MESVIQMVLCLKQHSKDRGLTTRSGYANGQGYGGTTYNNVSNKPHRGYLHGRSPRYWICAYANRQGDLGAEIDVPLEETSFVRALRLCKGTVTVLDQEGIVYTRIWWYVCVHHTHGLNMVLTVYMSCIIRYRSTKVIKNYIPTICESHVLARLL